MITKLSKLALISAISCGLMAQATPASAERTITCKSHKGRYNYCRVDTRGGVKLRKQISDASCRQGRSWGYDRDGIWVDRGCSAQFTLRGRGSNDKYNNNNSGGDTAAIIGGALVIGAIAAAIASGSDDGNNYDGDNITCHSREGRYTRCNFNLRDRDQVRLKRQLSNAGCWEGDTWGYDRDGIWVDNGCRGVFEVGRTRRHRSR